MISTALSGALATVAYFTEGPHLTTAILALAVISAGTCGAAGYVITIDLGGRHVTALFSVMNMTGNLGAAALIKFVPTLAQSQSWNAPLLLVAGLHFLAAICWALLNAEGSIFPEAKKNTSSSKSDR